MARERTLGRDRPITYRIPLPAGTAGNTNDAVLLQPLFSVPQEKYAMLPGQVGKGLGNLTRRSGALTVREVEFINQSGADVVGNAANNAELRLNVYRGGVLQGMLAYYSLAVATTLGTAIGASGVGTYQQVAPTSATGIVEGLGLVVDTSTVKEIVYATQVGGGDFTAYWTQQHATSAILKSILPNLAPIAFIFAMGSITNSGSSTVAGAGSATITPVRIHGIHVGDLLDIDLGTANWEQVTVTAVTNATFTANFTLVHSAAFTIQTNKLANGNPFILRSGDVVTYERVSNNATGLPTPAGLLQIDCDIAGEIGSPS